jgi:hypothetical protein
MSSPTIPKKLIQQLIFGGDLTSKESIEDDFEKRDEKRREGGWGDRPSAYVTVFEGVLLSFPDLGIKITHRMRTGMVATIIEHEHGLLSEQEIATLEHFSRFSCKNAIYMHANCLS